MKIRKFNEQAMLWDEENLRALKSHMRDRPKDKVYKFTIDKPFSFSVKVEDDQWRLKTLLTRYDVPFKLDIEEI